MPASVSGEQSITLTMCAGLKSVPTATQYHESASHGLAEFVPAWKNQRFDNYRYGSRILQNFSDIDIVKLTQIEAVDRNDGTIEIQLMMEVRSDQAAHIAIARQYDGIPASDDVFQGFGDAAAERVEPVERG